MRNSTSAKYDPFLIPPNIDIALQHFEANKVHFKRVKPSISCACCGKNANIQKFQMNSKDEDFAIMGLAFAFFFKLMKFQAQIFVLIFIIVGLPSIYLLRTSIFCFADSHCKFDNFNEEYTNGVLIM